MNELILSFFKEGNKMKGTTLYHLLRGKRTTSVLVYGFFHQVLPYFGAFPILTESAFFQILQNACKKGFLEESDGDYQLTNEGQFALARQSVKFPEIDYFSYGKTGQTSWRLIKFAIQVVSYLSYQDKSYRPLENSPYYTNQLKKWLRSQEKATLALQLKEELTFVFQKLPIHQANFLANQFSGKEVAGAVEYQLLPEEWQQSPDNQLYEDNAIHGFLRRLEELPQSKLYLLVQESLLQNHNLSAQKTQQLFLQGANKEQVMAQRHLKRSTVSDHLIEWAIRAEDFPFDWFIPREIEVFLRDVKSPVLTWQYSELIKQIELSYESFRLVQIKIHRERSGRCN
ncbi:hypothetical protein BAU15_09595 [Enterococcus sp. JM4C]|uniref:helix-turn-helix domain-containing protein n=1 Tax=Candidatus Enterococcus huntleyi TaxID=1857217 RepID=UPI0013798EC2|nr:helix-turn-helix domain-containing protein [Enterococcus sp. JM4C]KAF1298092.1 hypothetical protein BAU15_09595 [Enterococcus sp. JM4C]